MSPVAETALRANDQLVSIKTRGISSLCENSIMYLTFHNFSYSLLDLQRVFRRVCCKDEGGPLVVCDQVDGVWLLMSDRYSDCMCTQGRTGIVSYNEHWISNHMSLPTVRL